MDYFYSIILGVIQGVTEFLPISSSGHLIFFREILNFKFVSGLAFDVSLHWGTLLALIFYFWKDLLKYLKAFFGSLVKPRLREDFDQRMSWYLILGSIPAAILGFFFEEDIDRYTRSLPFVAGTLILVGILFFIFEKYSAKKEEMGTLNLKKVLIIGLAQSLALIPGVSRSGITIIAGLSQKLKREVAARFSFLLSIPIVFGAGLKKAYDVLNLNLENSDYLIMLLGLLFSFLSGYLVIKYFLRYLQNHTLNAFAVYRFILALAIIIYLLR